MKDAELALSFFKFAYEFQKQKKFNDAIKYYKKTIELNPNIIESYLNLGHILCMKKQYKESIECYKKVIAIKPDLYVAYSQLGYNYFKIKEFEKARLYLQKALLNRQYHLGLEIIVDLLIKCLKILDININIIISWLQIASYLKTIYIKPDLYEAYINIADNLYQINEIEKADEFKQKALKINYIPKNLTNNKIINSQKENQTRINKKNHIKKKNSKNFINNCIDNKDNQDNHYLQYKDKKKPDFMIIGCPRCASTALYEYMIRHPQILPTAIKEINYFNNTNFDECLDLYLAYYPSISGNYIIGESSVEYLYDIEISKRIVKFFPNIKLIIIIREPVERAFSDYKHICKIHNIKQNFLDFIEDEALGKNNFKIIQKGLYVSYLKNWMKIFPNEQFLIIRSEDFFERRDFTLNRIFKFLEISDHKFNFKSFHPKPHNSFSDNIRIKLSDFYRPYNKMLENLIGKYLYYN